MAAALAELEAKIGEHCESVTWATTGIFVVSIFLSILRPDPSLTICLFGFYGNGTSCADLKTDPVGLPLLTQ